MYNKEEGPALVQRISDIAGRDTRRTALGPYLARVLKDMGDILVDRGANYSDIAENSEVFSALMQASGIIIPPSMSSVEFHCLTNIYTKLARMASGARDHEDNWVDIANYAVLALADLRRRKDDAKRDINALKQGG